MNLLTHLALFAIWILAIWKLHDLIIGSAAAKRLEASQKTITLMAIFFAEFTHKAIESKTQYEPAPKEIYEWLDASFREWAKTYQKR